MSASSNLDLVRSVFAAWERGDYSAAEWAHPQIEFVRADGPEAGTWSGSAGLASGTRDRLGAWQDLRMIAEKYCELDGDRVLVLYKPSGRGRASGLELEQLRADGACVFHVHARKVTRLVTYNDRQLALADLGLAD